MKNMIPKSSHDLDFCSVSKKATFLTRGICQIFQKLNRHGRIQNILATHGYENTDWFFNMVLCVFMVKAKTNLSEWQTVQRCTGIGQKQRFGRCLIGLFTVFALLLIPGPSNAMDFNSPNKTTIYLDFENVLPGHIPDGWKIEATNSTKTLAVWQVIKDATAPSGNRVLALTNATHSFGNTYNLCWTKDISFMDGTVSVKFKANSGREDEGGGIIWRAQDCNNYYVTRFNPLEDNFRMYYVRNGIRRMLASAHIALDARHWHSMKIVVNGNKFEACLDGKKLLHATNDVFNRPGGVGLWTKADAATSFDDFKVIITN